MRFCVAAAVLLAGGDLFSVQPVALAGTMGASAQAAVVNTAQQPSAAVAIGTAIEKEGLAAARAKMEDIDAHAGGYAISERDINNLGYRYLGRRAFPEALAVFEFNRRHFPASNNVYDSLAEASVAAGDEARFEATLTAWLAQSPGDAAVATRTAELRALAARSKDERRHGYRAGEPTGVQGPYFGQAPPGTTPVLFAPGIVSLAFAREGFGGMSPDGKEFFFEASGRTPGAQVAPPAGLARYGGDPPAVMVSRLGPGGWTFPEQAGFTAGFAAREPHLSPDNRRLYWEWFRAVPAGEPDPQNIGTGIWASDRTPSGWSEPTFVGQGMALTSSRNGEVFVTDLSEIAKGNGYVAKVRMKDGKFAGFDRQQGGLEALRSEKIRYLAHPAIAPDGSFLLFDSGGPPTRLCFRNDDGTWGEAIDLSQHGLERAAVTSVSPDGKYLFLSKGGDIYWVSTQLIEALRPARAGKREHGPGNGKSVTKNRAGGAWRPAAPGTAAVLCPELLQPARRARRR